MVQRRRVAGVYRTVFSFIGYARELSGVNICFVIWLLSVTLTVYPSSVSLLLKFKVAFEQASEQASVAFRGTSRHQARTEAVM